MRDSDKDHYHQFNHSDSVVANVDMITKTVLKCPSYILELLRVNGTASVQEDFGFMSDCFTYLSLQFPRGEHRKTTCEDAKTEMLNEKYDDCMRNT